MNGGFDYLAAVRDLLPGGDLRNDEYWCLCPFHKDTTPSFSVNIENGLFSCFGCGEKGNFKRLIKILGYDWQEIRERYGGNGRLRAGAKKSRRKPPDWEAIWAQSDPRGQVALRYLRSRGLPIEQLPEAFREYRTADGKILLLVKLIDRKGTLCGYQRVFLSRDGKKAPEGKKAWPGSRLKGAFSLIGIALEELNEVEALAVAEGPETALAVHLATGWPTIVAVSASNLPEISYPRQAKVVFFADKDLSKTGEREARKAVKKFRAGGQKATMILPPGEIPEGQKSLDFLDVYTRQGPDVIRELGEKALRELETLDKPPRTPQDLRVSPCGRYGIRDGSFWVLTKEGGLKERISNFTCEILEELEIKTGEEEALKFFKLRARLEDGSEKTFLFPASSYYEVLKWVKAHIGARARIFPGVSGRKFCDCVDAFSNPQQITEVGRSGWICENGEWRFVFPGPHAKELLGLARFPYGVPENPNSALAKEAAPFIFRLPPVVVTGLLGAVTFATMREFWRQAGIFQGVSFILVGKRNTFKTSTALAFLSLLGKDWPRTSPETFGTATGNRLLALGYYFKDLPLLLDDFFPGVNQEDNRRLFEVLDRLLRVAGNASERGRLTANSALDRERRFEAVPIITAEFLPVLSESSLSRVFVIPHIRPDFQDLESLEDHAEGLNHLGGFWLRYLAEKAPELSGYLKKQLRERRKSPHFEELREREFFRTVDNFAVLDASLGVFLAFLSSLGVDAREPAQVLALGLKELLNAFLGRTKETDTVALFLEGLKEILASGQAILPAREEYKEDFHKPVIGVLSDEEIWLFPQATEKELNTHLTKLNRPPIRLGRAFYAELKKRGLLTWEVPTKVVKIGGRSHRVLGLRWEVLGGEEDVPF